MFTEIKEHQKKIIIAGPCSAESKEQIETIGHEIDKIDEVQMMRCGTWKPRTRPGGFEGRGVEALRWLQELKVVCPKLKIAVEVATTDHVEEALRYGIDALWIGSRTTANPFAVGKLADALKGTAVPVMVKNPPQPDLNLWIGAIERLQKVGLTDLAAVHRGFYTADNKALRNAPLWQIPIELRRQMPQLPLLCDPSHISGDRRYIQSIAQMALDLDFDGLMIEVHPQPETALTDAAQQITPNELKALLSKLKHTSPNCTSPHLVELRRRLTTLDSELIRLLAERDSIAREVASLKAETNTTIFQPAQWEHKLKQCLEQAEALGMDKSYIHQLFEQIHLHSIEVQQQTISNIKEEKI